MAIKNLGKVVGADGKSAYEIWLDNGNTGTEQDFLDSLKGGGSSNSDVWLGSESEYTIALGNGTITSNTICLITDEEGETTTIVQNGDVLEVYSGVTVTQNNDELEVK